MLKRKTIHKIITLPFILFAFGCNAILGTDDISIKSSTDSAADTDTDTDADTGTDTDTDKDTDTDTNDSGGSSSVDTDSNTDTDSGTNIDTYTDMDTAVCEPFQSRKCKNVLGNCAKGNETCLEDGSGWSNCSILPETSDSCELDDDANCNGMMNEGCSCTAESVRSCGPADEGICKSGTQSCIGGTWSSDCIGQVLPEERDCASEIDNDCDGVPDNNTDSDCNCIPGAKRSCDPYGKGGIGICTLGEQRCVYVNGTSTSDWSSSCIGAVEPKAEVCDENLTDEDCDGIGNEGCNCVIGTEQDCGTNVGVCEYGSRSCEDGLWPTACEGGIEPGTRDCNSSKDNDCDNFADNITDDVCQCENSKTRSCLVPGEQGICQSGTQSCIMANDNSNSHWGTCQSINPAGTELCNNDDLDEDCDGLVNEGCECINGNDAQCDDGISCTTDTCSNGQCNNIVANSKCLIGNICYDNNDDNSNNTCQYCNAANNQKGWTTRDNGWYDSTNGYCWQVTPNAQPLTYAEADSYCTGLAEGWRIPTVHEAITIMRGCQDGSPVSKSLPSLCTVTNCSVDYCNRVSGCAMGCPTDEYWPSQLEGEAGQYWTSTYSDSEQSLLWGASYSMGFVINTFRATTPTMVRCVH
ncbi:MAG: DUF1566 domain-containing protein [Deltaproteobacteria bacterium]|nr:DUF1566 domain-containing protein [Deltaproteobacteria bacterium]